MVIRHRIISQLLVAGEVIRVYHRASCNMRSNIRLAALVSAGIFTTSYGEHINSAFRAVLPV